MVTKPDSTRPLTPRELIFSCNICHESIRDICTPPQEEKGLDGVRKPVAKLWMTECAHLTCAKHFDGGAPPFHPAGRAPRVVCPVCVKRQNNHAQRQIFPINGFANDEHDPEIPDRFFKCPPVELDGKGDGQDALRFQFLCLVYQGISVTAKYRTLQAAYAQLKDQVEKERFDKAEAETEVHALGERVELLEAAIRKHRSKQPEIEHYLRQFTTMKAELDRRYEDLQSLGFHCSRVDFSFHPADVLEDEEIYGGRNTSHTEQTAFTELDHQGSRAIEEQQVPSISSTTLRGDSSRTSGGNDAQTSPKKRQKISEFVYIPKAMEHLQQPNEASRSTSKTLMPPPKHPASKSPLKRQHMDRYLPDRTDSNHRMVDIVNGDSTVEPIHRDTSQVYRDPPRQRRIQTDESPYMSGALQGQNISPVRPPPSPVHRESPRRTIQPVDDFPNLVIPMATHQENALEGRFHSGPSKVTTQIYQKQSSSSLPTSGIRDPRSNQANVTRTKQGGYIESHHEPRSHNVPYRVPFKQPSTRPFTPSPQHIGIVQESQQPSVSSPFFHGRQSHDQNVSSIYRVTPSTRDVRPKFARSSLEKQMREPPPSAVPGRTLNGLSFVRHPQLSFDGAYAYDTETQEQNAVPRTSRDQDGFFVRPDMAASSQTAASPRYETRQPRYHDNRPQPLPSAIPSLASSINMTRTRGQPMRDGELASVRGVKGASASSRGQSSGMFGSNPGLFSRGGSRRSVRR